MAALSICALSLLLLACNRVHASTNRLATGDQASTKGPVDIALLEPQALNFKSRYDVLNMRRVEIEKQRLITNAYNPTPDIFSEIQDNKPWWGMHGQFVWGEGEHSIEGPAEESRFLLNPYMLVAPSSWTTEIWDRQKITAADLDRRDFPFSWMPESLRWWPSNATAQAVYNITQFDRNLSTWKDRLYTGDNHKFGLVAYNARDFDLNFLYIVPDKSKNITNSHKSKEAWQIVQKIHCGDSCKYPGGCNNMSPAAQEVDDISLAGLPARACIYLWKDRPQNTSQRPDFTYVIDFK